MVRTHGMQSGTKMPRFLDWSLDGKERYLGADERTWGISIPMWNWQK